MAPGFLSQSHSVRATKRWPLGVFTIKIMDELLVNISFTLISYVKANILAAIIVFLVYIIEINTGLKIFYGYFKMKKSPKNAKIAADGNTGYYIIFCLIVFTYDIFYSALNFHFLTALIWFLFIIPSAIVLHKVYNRYQVVNFMESEKN